MFTKTAQPALICLLLQPWRAVITSLLLAAALSACDSSSDSSPAPAFDPEVLATMEAMLVERMETYGVPGALVGLYVPGRQDVVMAQGVSDIDTAAALGADDHMRVGSVTKSFTVTVILQLVDEGLLSLDDPLSRFFPDIENSDATIAELANMRSGIYNYTEDGAFVDELVEDFLRVWMPQEIVAVADRNAPYFAPGDGWHYSNTSTIILGMIIEQLTGNPVGVEIHQRIIAPLALAGTLYPTSPDIPAPFSKGYMFAGPEVGLLDITLTDPSSSAASGAMISRLADLRVWAVALGRGTLLSEGSQRERINSLAPIVYDPCDDSDPQRPARVCPEYDQYGLGIGEIDGWIGHTGEGLGYTVLVMYEPASSAVMVVMMNRSGVENHTHVPTLLFREYAELLRPLL
ncbi:MAG: beta-lactamase family protein [Halioglobus sp.]|nr:beta-lactamase family protein [Halioglobus sp.]